MMAGAQVLALRGQAEGLGLVPPGEKVALEEANNSLPVPTWRLMIRWIQALWKTER